MYKTITKTVNLSSLNSDSELEAQFNNIIEQYIKMVKEGGYKPDYISYHNSALINTRYSSNLWLIALKKLYTQYIDEEIHTIPNGITIQVIDSNISPKIRSNQKWLIDVNYLYKCEVCKELFDKNCICIK